MKVLLIVAAAFGAILLFLLATASANTALFARHYPWLIGLNVVVAIALGSLVTGVNVVRGRWASGLGPLRWTKVLMPWKWGR